MTDGLRDFDASYGFELATSDHKRYCEHCSLWIDPGLVHLIDLLVNRRYHQACAEEVFYPIRRWR